MKKLFVCFTIFISILANCLADSASISESFDLTDYQKTFYLTPFREAVILGGGVALSGTALVLDKIVKVKNDEYDGDLKAKSTIPNFDQLFMNPYSKGLDVTCDLTRIAMLAAPVALFGLTTDKSEWLTIGTMYAESLLWTYGSTELLKMAVNRVRPYMYYSGAPEDDLKNGDWKNSFPSGHTSICFTTAAFTSYVFSQYYPESGWKWGVTGISFGLAGTVAALRMAGGCHYFTDVFTGALIGTVSGFIIPWIHIRAPAAKKTRGFDAQVAPGALVFTYRK